MIYLTHNGRCWIFVFLGKLSMFWNIFAMCSFFPHRLKKMPQSMPEYALTRNYLELMVELPWNKSTTGKPTK